MSKIALPRTELRTSLRELGLVFLEVSIALQIKGQGLISPEFWPLLIQTTSRVEMGVDLHSFAEAVLVTQGPQWCFVTLLHRSRISGILLVTPCQATHVLHSLGKCRKSFLLNISAGAVWSVTQLYLLAIRLPQVHQLNLKGFIDQQSVVYSIFQPSWKMGPLLFSKEQSSGQDTCS